MTHLTTESLDRLLSGTADPAEARALAKHLEEECDACGALLASPRGAPLDAVADHALTALTPPCQDELGNDLEYARILRQVRSQRRARPMWAPLTVIAAVLLVAGVSVHLRYRARRDGTWDGLKGVAAGPVHPVSVRLSAVAVLTESQSQPRAWKVASGDSLPRDAALQLRVEVGGPADLALARVAPGGIVDVFWSERVASAGTVQIAIDGEPAAYPLSTLSGSQRFVVLASAGPVERSRIEAAARMLAPPGGVTAVARGADGLSIDVLEISVR